MKTLKTIVDTRLIALINYILFNKCMHNTWAVLQTWAMLARLQTAQQKLTGGIKFASLMVCTLALFSLSACDKENLDKLTQMAKQQQSTHANKTFCSVQSAPFAHTLCQVAQDSLTQADNTLTLNLFWRPQSTGSIDNKDAIHSSGAIDKPMVAPATNNPINAMINTPDPAPKPLYTFAALLTDLPKNATLKFATNAGMYDSEFAPIGYTVLQGQQVLSLNLNTGGGNFHLMPNGVFWWNKAGQVYITESNKMSILLQNGDAKPWFATQSGPMLVINGKIHPKFNKDSTSKKFRNGVGVCKDGRIKFVNSQVPVNFYQFAHLFQADLNCTNALFLDGGIASALYAPDVDIHDLKNMGVIIGLIEQ